MGTNSLPTFIAKAVAQTAPARVAATAFLLRRVFSPARPPAQYFSTVIASVQSDNNLVALQVGGNASAVIKGTMISYSPDPTVVQGNISMDFDRAAMVEIPAGFDLYRVLTYNPASYTMAQ